MRRQYNTCRRCSCSLDAGEGMYCEDCRREIGEEREYAARWSMTAEQVRELRKGGLIRA